MAAVSAQSRRTEQGSTIRRARQRSPRPHGCISAFSTRAAGANGRSARSGSRSIGRSTRIDARARGPLRTRAGPSASAACAISAASRQAPGERRLWLKIEEAIPPHAGLGSGTQLALAVGSAFAALEDLRLDPQEIAARLGRGARSGIGIATFAQGGVVLDSGAAPRQAAAACQPPPLPRRVARASDLRFRVRAGSPGRARRTPSTPSPTFRRTRPPNCIGGSRRARCRRLRRKTSRRSATRSGSCKLPWAPISRLCKGDPMRAPRSARRSTGCAVKASRGLGQSSWGPTGFAFAASEAEGQALLRGLRAEIRHRGLSFELAQGRNEGAKIETTASEIQ